MDKELLDAIMTLQRLYGERGHSNAAAVTCFVGGIIVAGNSDANLYMLAQMASIDSQRCVVDQSLLAPEWPDVIGDGNG